MPTAQIGWRSGPAGPRSLISRSCLNFRVRTANHRSQAWVASGLEQLSAWQSPAIRRPRHFYLRFRPQECSSDRFPLKPPEAPNVPFFRYEKKTLLELPISARPPQKRSPPEKRSTKSPSSSFLMCTRLRIFALVLRIVALVLHFDFCSLLSTIQRKIILEDRPARFWENHSKQENVYVYHILVTTPGFAIRLGYGQKFR